MKVGILTLHSQLNYGGILQCYALQEVVKSLGHDVLIINRSMFQNNAIFHGILSSTSIIEWAKFIGRGILGFGDFPDLMRRIKTKRFINHVLNLSPYSFFQWKDAPKSLGVDLLIIGSDQVWNPTDPNVLATHLLEGAPQAKAISYAASFGIGKIPPDLQCRYTNGLSRFDKISVRESEGAKIVSELGFSATKVLDPVMLPSAESWNNISHAESHKQKILFCYFLSIDVNDLFADLIAFAKRNNATVRVFPAKGCVEMPSTLSSAIGIPIQAIRQRISRLRMRTDASPDEFVSDIRSSSWVLTDSFHALAFSMIFNKNVRAIRPTDDFRKDMFSRIEETAKDYMTGPVISNTCRDALSSFSAGETTTVDIGKLAEDKAKSLQWLKNALRNAHA